MSIAPSPVYEVTLCVDREIADTFDDWLAGHVREMLEMPGFVRAVSFTSGDDDPDRVRRVTQYFVESDDALEAYLSGPAEAMRHEALTRFPDRFTASRRILHHVDSAEETELALESCLNCATPLMGQYCANCGQRARSRLISIWELVRDAFGDLFELDSRLWRTLIPLVIRPGRLTREYLMGRRARFMPPFRTYLALSLVFFVIAFFDPQQQLGMLFEPVEPRSAEIRRQVLRDLKSEGLPVQVPPENEGDSAEQRLKFDCDIGDFENVPLPGWMARRLTPERLDETCERVTADNGRAFVQQLLDNVPASLFILLPLMALVLKTLYPLSKRYYAEHLLFVLHFHAFVFLILTLEIVFSRLVSLVRLPDAISELTAFAVSLYIPVYLFKALRRVYGQGRAITFVKYVLLLFSYFFGLFLILLFVLLYTAMSI